MINASGHDDIAHDDIAHDDIARYMVFVWQLPRTHEVDILNILVYTTLLLQAIVDNGTVMFSTEPLAMTQSYSQWNSCY